MANLKDFIKKADLILLAIILALSVLGFVVLRKNSNANSKVVISVGGETVKTVSLFEDAEIKIGDSDYNVINIKGGKVWVSEANCPNGDCKRFGVISKEGQVILCLPHKLAVTISGGEAQSDAISY